jgi:YtcA family
MKKAPGNFLCCTACVLLIGCGRAPAVNIIGSFLPAWMICLTAGVILAFAARSVLLRYRLETEVGPLALFYPCVVILMTCLLWLILFH